MGGPCPWGRETLGDPDLVGSGSSHSLAVARTSVSHASAHFHLAHLGGSAQSPSGSHLRFGGALSLPRSHLGERSVSHARMSHLGERSVKAIGLR